MLLGYASAIDRRNHRLSASYFAQDIEVNCRAFTAKGIDAFFDYRIPRHARLDRHCIALSISALCSIMDETMNEIKTGKSGPVHKTPTDLRMALRSEAKTQAAWKNLTPLARNEWICWVISAKQDATRGRRIQRAIEDLQAGKRRPCCWPGCPHRRPSAQKWFERRAR